MPTPRAGRPSARRARRPRRRLRRRGGRRRRARAPPNSATSSGRHAPSAPWGCRLSRRRAPAVSARPTATSRRFASRGRATSCPAAPTPRPPHTRDRFLQRLRPLEANLVLGQRPGDEVHVRVREAREDAAAAEVHDLRRRERRLVSADAAGDPVACDRERPRDRQRGVECPDDAVLEDHAERI